MGSRKAKGARSLHTSDNELREESGQQLGAKVVETDLKQNSTVQQPLLQIQSVGLEVARLDILG